MIRSQDTCDFHRHGILSLTHKGGMDWFRYLGCC